MMEDGKDARIRNLEWQNKILRKTSDDEIWYYRFDRYIEEMEYNITIKYDPRLKRWFQYENGVYHQIEKEEIHTIINDWASIVNEKLTRSKLGLVFDRIKAICLFKGQWDIDPNIDNCLDGLVFKTERELHPHTPEYPSLEQIQRHYIESEGIIPDLFVELLSIIPSKEERDWFIQFCINIVHKNFEDELFVMFYGPKGGGKSSILQLFEALFGIENVSKTQLHKFGKRFGLKELYNKRLNVNPDLPIVPMTDFTISILKQLTGNDGMMEVELKGRDAFRYPVRCFLIFGINQLMEFAARSEKEIESIFRRALLIHLPTTLKRNTKFKKSLRNDVFLDELYSWFVWMRPSNIIDDDEIDSWVNIQKKKWLNNSNPILKICKDLYQYKVGSKIFVKDVIEAVRNAMEGEGYHSSQQFQTNVSQALQTMNIYRDNGRGMNAKYVDIEQKVF